MLDLLDEHCVNVWILEKDLRAMGQDESLDPSLRTAVRTALERIGTHRLAPVGIQVISPDGELRAHASVNDDRLMGPSGTAKYLEILRRGVGSEEED